MFHVLRWWTERTSRGARWYTDRVRRRLAAALVVVIATVTLADPLWCADGCRERPLTAGHQPNLSGGSDDCVTCQVPLSPPMIVPLEPSVRLVGPIAVADESSAALCDPGPLERPPRLV
jgi:hypothetical protein